jgi:hypothetical protein
VEQAMKKHVEATRELTRGLLEKGDTDFERDSNARHEMPSRNQPELAAILRKRAGTGRFALDKDE